MMSTPRKATLLALMVALLAFVGVGPAQAQGEPPATDPFVRAVTTALADGTYAMDVTLEGGSGRASVSSPARVEVKDGKAAATIEWSSPHYDYMLVAQECYLPVNEEGNSVFEIPVLAFDEPFSVVADTTAMSQPHEIAYQLTFDAQSARTTEAETAGIPLPIVALAVAGLGVAAGIAAKRAHANSSTSQMRMPE